MIIVELIGCQCSGRREVLHKVNKTDVAIFDMEKYYENEGCMVNGRVDWDFGGRQALEKLPGVLNTFFDSTDKPLCVITHSYNRTIQETISKRSEEKYKITLNIPLVADLEQKAQQRGLDIRRVALFADQFEDRLEEDPKPNLHTHEQAICRLQSLIVKDRIIVRNGLDYGGPGELITQKSPLSLKQQASISEYRKWLWDEISVPHYMTDNEVHVELLRLLILAKHEPLNLVCHCSPLPCHGDVVRNCLAYLDYKERLDAMEETNKETP